MASLTRPTPNVAAVGGTCQRASHQRPKGTSRRLTYIEAGRAFFGIYVAEGGARCVDAEATGDGRPAAPKPHTKGSSAEASSTGPCFAIR